MYYRITLNYNNGILFFYKTHEIFLNNIIGRCYENRVVNNIM